MAAPAAAFIIAVIETTEAEPQNEEGIILTAEGPDYTVKVACGPEAEIPADAVLSVREVEDWKVGEEEIPSRHELAFSRAFDISILNAEGEKIQPKSDVRVSIDLPEANDAETIQVLHYADEEEPLSVEEELSPEEEELPVEKGAESLRGLKRGIDTSDLQFGKQSLRGESAGLLGVSPDEPENSDGVVVTHSDGEELPAEEEERHTDGEAEQTVEEPAVGEPLDATVEDGIVSFSTGSFSIFAVIGLRTLEKQIVASDGRTYDITVSFGPEAGIPDGAELEVTEFLEDFNYDTYLTRTLEVLGADQVEYARFFDISIIKDGESVQPAEGSCVSVKISLADADSEELQVLHFGEDVSLIGAKVEDSEISFETDGFSVYAIVDADVDPYEPTAEEVINIEEFKSIRYSTTGFYLSYDKPKKYFGSELNEKGCLIEKTNCGEAAIWYFEPVANQENQYYLYTIINGLKKYIKQTTENSIKLSETEKTALCLEFASDGKFYLKHAEQNRWLQHSNGGGGIRFYTDKNNATNSRITFTYASSIVIPNDVYELDGETWGIVYDSESIFCTALMSEASSAGSLRGEDMANLETQGHSDHLFVPLDSDITEWTFSCVEGDKYKLSTNVNGEEKYLIIENNYVRLGSSEDASIIQVIPGTGNNKGFYSFVADGYALTIEGEEGNRSFTGSGNSTDKRWMKLAEKSPLTEDDYLIYTAKKIRVSDPAEQVILYTRVWTGSKYEFYAVDYDGSLIRCYDDGDVIKWVGNQYETAVFNLTNYIDYDNQGNPVNGRYGLQNAYSGQYIAPQMNGNTVLSDSLVKLNLDGRFFEEDYTKIRCWDDTYYSYIGLKVDLENNKVVPCPPSQADDFYFARVKSSPVNLTEVKTIDNNDYGITMKMIDFNNPIKDNRDSVQTEYFGKDSNRVGLLTTNLGENGYPGTTHNNGSLGNLFQGDYEVNQLFIQSIYDESGYFEYDSTKNYAYLNGNEFEVYDQLGTIERENKKTMYHGQFMPYNSLINPATGEPWPYSEMFTNTTSVTADPLSVNDPRYGEGLHQIPKSVADYFFGMEMSASFTQTPSGVDAWGNDIIFEFSGDDDFWLYVDGELVLDLGGVHQASSGTVNFRTGEVVQSVRNASGGIESARSITTTLYQIFRNNFTDSARGLTSDQIEARLENLFEEKDGNYVFKDFSVHDMQVYYMERGAGASNLHMRFNLTAVKPGEVTLSKKITGSDDIDYDLMEFPYQIYYLTRENSGSEGNIYQQLTQNENDPTVTYEGSKRPVKFAETFTPVGETNEYKNVFFLKPGEAASINMPNDVIDYYIVECGVNMNIFKTVSANGTVLSQGEHSGRHDYSTVPASIEDRPEVEYTNEVDPDSLRTLTITKKLWDENGYTIENEGTDSETRVGNQLIGYIDDDALFSYVVSMSAQGSPSVIPVRNKNYYVKNPEGYYCKRDVTQQKFVSLGINDFSDLNNYLSNLPEDEKMFIVFETSTKGEIEKIPGGYSVEFRGLPVDSFFKVEEPENTIPEGYKWIDYERDKGSYISDSDEPNEGMIRASEDPHVLVHNKRGWGLTVNKIWSDADYMESHDDIYFAIYLNNAHSGEGQTESGSQNTDPTLLEGSVRKLDGTATSIYYYFDNLAAGYSFEDYQIYEVRLTNPRTDENGIIIYDDIDIINEGGTFSVGGKPVNGEHVDDYSYIVTYSIGEPSGGHEQFKNVREDTVTNTRRGIKLFKTDWNGAVLPGAVFTLKNSDGNPVGAETYTSDVTGLITIAYLTPGTYTLEETEHPSTFRQPSQPWTITLEDDGKAVSVDGDEGSYTVIQETTDEMAVVKVKNKGFSLRAIKVEDDESSNDDGNPLQGAVFALYRQKEVVSGNVKDQNPMSGYEALTTGDDGIIPQITSALPAGTYYLSEVNPPSGYKRLAGDLVFVISDDGTVSIPKPFTSGDPDTLIILNNQNDLNVAEWIKSAEEGGHITYTIRIPNSSERKISFQKVDAGNHSKNLEGAKFDLYEVVDGSQAAEPRYSNLISNEQGILYCDGQCVFVLPNGVYHLVETEAPPGYNLKTQPVVITVNPSGITYDEGSTLSSSGLGKSQDSEDICTLIITNSAGLALPSTGSPGTLTLSLIGTSLTLLAAAGYVLANLPRRKEDSASWERE